MSFEYLIQPGGAPRSPADKRPEQKPLRVLVEPQDGERYKLTIRSEGGADGAAQTAEAREVIVSARQLARDGGAGTWSLIYGDEGGAQRVVDVDGVKPEAPDFPGNLPDLKVTVDGGEPIALKLIDARAAAALGGGDGGGGAAQAAGELRAAMPGKVVKLLCKVGDAIKAGQGLLIIEAMKMENEVRAGGAGQVKEIAVREGQTVEGGQLLVVLAAAQ